MRLKLALIVVGVFAAIAGTPRQRGSFRVTLGARDALGAKTQKTLVFLVTT